jgi:hypothetical protein
MNRSELAALAVKELRALAESHGIARSGKLKKDELVQALIPLLTPAPTAPTLAPPPGPAGSSHLETPQAPLPPAHEGLPIPDRYGRDRLVLMVQDPHHIFAYWEVTPGNLDHARSRAGEGWTPVLVVSTPTGTEQREVDLRGGNYYLAVAPASRYHAVLALRDRHGNLHRLAESGEAFTPAAGPSPSTDEQWMVVDETFQELLSLAGAGSESSTARFAAGSSGTLVRRRALDSRLLSWDMSEQSLDLLSSSALVRPGTAPSSLALATGPAGQTAPGALPSSHILSAQAAASALPLSVSSLQSSLVFAQSLSSHSLSSAAMSSSSGALVRVSERREVASADQDGHHRANTGLAERGTVPAVPPAPAGHGTAGSGTAGSGTAEPAPAAPGGQIAQSNPAAPAPAAATAPVPLHRLRGVDTIKPKAPRRR